MIGKSLFSCLVLILATKCATAEVVQSIVTPGLFYSPASATVAVGDTVAFSASGFHPLRSDDQLFACDSNCQLTFYSARVWPFHCNNHGDFGGIGMAGTLTVELDPDRIFANGGETPVFFAP